MIVLEDFIFVDFYKVKRDIIGVGFNGVVKKLDNERCFRNLQELDRESKLSGQNEYLDNLFWNYILPHIL